MDNSTLKSLLQEYEQKRLNANLNLEKRKKELYEKYPRLAEIENKINLLSIKKIKDILSSNKDDIKNIEQSIKELQDEKQRILKKENITNLSPVYECKFCNDTGYINKNGKTIMCHCLKQKLFNIQYNKSNIGNVEYENFSTFSSEFYSDEINPTKYGLNISPKENIEKIKKISENFIQNFDNPEEKNLLFTGDTRTW